MLSILDFIAKKVLILSKFAATCKNMAIFASEINTKVMKIKGLLVATALLVSTAAHAQELKLPHKVNNVKILDLENNETTLPMWGEKNLMIFYIDPDKHKQNQAFTEEMEANHRAEGDGIYGFGIMNLKDSGFPNGIVKSMARKRTAKNGATVLADQNRTLSTEWGLGDCNNLFVLMIVTKEGELVYMKKGELSEADKEEFYRVVDKYRH